MLYAAVRAEERGADLRRYTVVRAIDPDADGVTIKTDDGHAYRFRQAIIAPGPWAERLLPGLRPRIEVRRPIQAWFAPRHPELFTPDRFPIFARSSDVHCYGLPVVDNAGVKLGLSASDNEPVEDPDALNRTVSVSELTKFQEVIARFLPDLHPDPIRVDAYMEGYAPEGIRWWASNPAPSM